MPGVSSAGTLFLSQLPINTCGSSPMTPRRSVRGSTGMCQKAPLSPGEASSPLREVANVNEADHSIKAPGGREPRPFSSQGNSQSDRCPLVELRLTLAILRSPRISVIFQTDSAVSASAHLACGTELDPEGSTMPPLSRTLIIPSKAT